MISTRTATLPVRAVAVGAFGLIALAATLASGSTHLQATPMAGYPETLFVSPSGSDSNPGTQAQPLQTVQKAQEIVRTMNSNMTQDIGVVLEDGFYRMSQPLTLTAADSGSNGHTIAWFADPATNAKPVLAGSDQITGWSLFDSGRNIWVAQGPSGIQTRQLYVNGARASRASGSVPDSLTKTTSGYTSSGTTMAGWRDPSGGAPQHLEFVYHGGPDNWTEARCPVASISGTTITMAQPCWNNSTIRTMRPPPATRTYYLVGGPSVHNPTSVENAYALLTSPGQWYLDNASNKFYYMPKSGENMATADVEAPVLQYLVNGGGTASQPLHDVTFIGIQFSYATDMFPSTGEGFSSVQANYNMTGPHGFDQQGLCQETPTPGTCPYGDWPQILSNVSLTYDQNVAFRGDAFIHLGGAGLTLGDGSQNDTVFGSVFTDTSGNAIQIGNVDMPEATGSNQVLNNTVQDNYVHDTPVEYRDGIGIDVGYANGTKVWHNQVDNTPYSGMSIGWGGWPDKVAQPGEANNSGNNDIAFNLVFNIMQSLKDGAAIYTNGKTGDSFATGEKIHDNVLHDQLNLGHVVYSDNGTEFITITNNCIYNTGAANSWGGPHHDYYPGATTSDDPLDIENNFWSTAVALSGTGPGITFLNNTSITGPSGCPASLVANAGIEASVRASVLNWQQAPNPPVGGHPPTPTPCSGASSSPTSLVANSPVAGEFDLTWTAPTVCGPTPFYAVALYSVATNSFTESEVASTSFQATGLQSNTYYIATITAYNNTAWSAWSAYSNWVLMS